MGVQRHRDEHCRMRRSGYGSVQGVWISTDCSVGRGQLRGQCDGRLEILPTEAGYSYIWSTGDTTRGGRESLLGVYLVTVTSPGGCSTVRGYVAPALQLNVTINEVSNT